MQPQLLDTVSCCIYVYICGRYQLWCYIRIWSKLFAYNSFEGKVHTCDSTHIPFPFNRSLNPRDLIFLLSPIPLSFQLAEFKFSTFYSLHRSNDFLDKSLHGTLWRPPLQHTRASSSPCSSSSRPSTLTRRLSPR